MSKKLYEESNIQGIASAIREKNGTQNQYTVAQMPAAVRAIKTQPDLEVLNATENGNYLPSSGKDGFSSVTVNVESGEAVVQPLSVLQNGTYTPPSGVDGYAPVTVNVSGGGEIEFTQNLQWNSYPTASFTLEANSLYLFGTGHNRGSFTNAEFLLGNSTHFTITSGWGRALCVIKTTATNVVYTNSGNPADYNLAKINISDTDIFGVWKSWSSGNQSRTIKKGSLYLFLGPQMQTNTPGTFNGATIIAQNIQGNENEKYHHGALILATENQLGYSLEGTNYLLEVGLYSHVSTYIVNT